MEPLKRQIGYIRPEARKDTPIKEGTEKKGTIKSTQPISAEDAKDPSQKIADWILSHPEFKWSAMCLKLGIDKANFQRSFKAEIPNIKEEFIPKIESFLKNYGY